MSDSSRKRMLLKPRLAAGASWVVNVAHHLGPAARADCITSTVHRRCVYNGLLPPPPSTPPAPPKPLAMCCCLLHMCQCTFATGQLAWVVCRLCYRFLPKKVQQPSVVVSACKGHACAVGGLGRGNIKVGWAHSRCRVYHTVCCHEKAGHLRDQ